MAMTDEKPEKVTTDDPDAEAAIQMLRKVAVTLKALGDENCGHAMRDRIDQLEQDLEIEREKTGSVEAMEDLLRDFRRGIVDKDELIDRTVGKYD